VTYLYSQLDHATGRCGDVYIDGEYQEVGVPTLLAAIQAVDAGSLPTELHLAGHTNQKATQVTVVVRQM
jgi:hypothetical protein